MAENESYDEEIEEEPGIPEVNPAPKVYQGIPPGIPESIPQANLSCKLRPEEKTQLEIAARAAERSLSSFIRQTLLDSLKEQNEPQKSSTKTASISEPELIKQPNLEALRNLAEAKERHRILFSRAQEFNRKTSRLWGAKYSEYPEEVQTALKEGYLLLSDSLSENAELLRMQKDVIEGVPKDG